MAISPQLTGLRLWPVIGRRNGVPKQASAERVMTAEAEVLRRVGEVPRHSQGSGTAARALIARQRWM